MRTNPSNRVAALQLMLAQYMYKYDYINRTFMINDGK